MDHSITRRLGVSLAVSLAFTLGACGSGMNMQNRTLYSVKQPVVERSNYTLDLATNATGLTIGEQQRLAEWFESLDLRHGDRIAVESASNSDAVREDVASIAGRYGLLLAEGVPVTAGYPQPGQARVVITRSTASVPGCPDWSHIADANPKEGTSTNYGCAVNSNLAAMVANPEDLIKGQQGSGETIVTTSTKAIRAYREQRPTGTEALAENATTNGGN